MSVHYKFKAAVGYDTVQFDGLHISVGDLKKSIILQKRLGKATDFDLQITNAQTKEVYTDETTLIPKNTSVLVARIPLANPQQKKVWEVGEATVVVPKMIDAPEDSDFEPKIVQSVDLANLDASEEDKIKAMMTQSTLDYDPSKYLKIRGSNQFGPVPSNYRCYKCHQPGHWIKNCPLNQIEYKVEIKKSTGIPRSFMVPVEDPRAPGALMTSTGHFAVPKIDHEAYKEGKKERPPFTEEMQEAQLKQEVPQELVCSLCHDLLHDAVMIPCCGNSYCDECIRSSLLESEDHECPDCHEKKVSPDTLIPNRFLRTTVMSFRNETGYVRRQSGAPAAPVVISKAEDNPLGLGEESCDGVTRSSDLNLNEDSNGSLVNAQSDDASKDFDYNVDDLQQRAATPTVDEEPTDSYTFYPDTSIPPPTKPVANITPLLHDFSQPPPPYKSPSSFSPVRNSPKYRSPSYKRNEGPRGRHHLEGRYPADGRRNVDSRRYIEGRRRHHQNGGSQRRVHQDKSAAAAPRNYESQSKSLLTVPVNEPAPPGVDIAPIPDVHRPPPPIVPPIHNYRNHGNGSRARNRGRGYNGQGAARFEIPGTIDDPLEAFQRIMRERDERERRMRAGAQYRDRRSRSGSQEFKRSSSRSWSRSRSTSPKFKEQRSWSKTRSVSRSASPKSPKRLFHASPRRFPPDRQGGTKKNKSYRNFNSPEKEDYVNQGRGFEKKKDYYPDEMYNYEEGYRFPADGRRNYDSHMYYNEYKNYRNSEVETFVEKQPIDSDRRYFARCYENSGFVGNYGKEYYDDYGKDYQERDYQYYRRKEHYNDEKSQYPYPYNDNHKGNYYPSDNVKVVNYGDEKTTTEDASSRDRSRRTRDKHGTSRNKRERSRSVDYHERGKDRVKERDRDKDKERDKDKDKEKDKDKDKDKEKERDKEKEKDRKVKKSKTESKSASGKDGDGKTNTESANKRSPEAPDKRKTKTKDKKRKKKRRVSEDADSESEKIRKKKKKDKKDKKEEGREVEPIEENEMENNMEPEVPCDDVDASEKPQEEVSRVVTTENYSMKVFSSCGYPTKFPPGGLQKNSTITIKLKDRDGPPEKDELSPAKPDSEQVSERESHRESDRQEDDFPVVRTSTKECPSSDEDHREPSPVPRRDVKITNSGLMVALPELSKWELEEEASQSLDVPSSDSMLPKDGQGSLSNEILKRAEKAIFEKPLKALRPCDTRRVDKKVEEEPEPRAKPPEKLLISDQSSKREPRSSTRSSREEHGESERRRIDRSKFSANKADGGSGSSEKSSSRSDRRDKSKDVKSTISRKSRSFNKDDKRSKSRSRDRERDKDSKERETKDKSRHSEGHGASDRGSRYAVKSEGRRERSPERDKRKSKFRNKIESKDDYRKSSKSTEDSQKHRDKREKDKGADKPASQEKRKSTIDESSFEPNYDVSSSSEGEGKVPEASNEGRKKPKSAKKRARSTSSDSDSSESSSSSSDSSSSSCDKSDSKDDKKNKLRKRHDSHSDASDNSVKSKSKSKQKKKVKKRKDDKRKSKRKKKEKKRR